MIDEMRARAQGGRAGIAVRQAVGILGKVPTNEEWESIREDIPLGGNRAAKHWQVQSMLHSYSFDAFIENAMAQNWMNENDWATELGFGMREFAANNSNAGEEAFIEARRIVRLMPNGYRFVHSLYLFGMNLKSIAEILGVTDCRVSQLYTRGTAWYRELAHLPEYEIERRRDEFDRKRGQYLRERREKIVEAFKQEKLSPHWIPLPPPIGQSLNP
jgi:hypothetical protein